VVPEEGHRRTAFGQSPGIGEFEVFRIGFLEHPRVRRRDFVCQRRVVGVAYPPVLPGMNGWVRQSPSIVPAAKLTTMNKTLFSRRRLIAKYRMPASEIKETIRTLK
jgi:hypothetical protein